jgi:hypothetical protein
MFRTAIATGLLVGTPMVVLVPQMHTATAAEAPAPTTLVAVDRAAAVGLGARRADTFSAVAADVDRDGAQDIWVGHHGAGAKLWANRGNGSYVRAARAAWPSASPRGRHIDRHDCAWADVDRNGRLDAYCSTGRMRSNLVKRGRDNELWLQGRRGGFREVGTRWGAGDLCGRGRQVTFLDANGDRWPDIFVGNTAPRPVPDPCDDRANGLPSERGKIFLNIRGTRFRHAPRLWNFGYGIGGRCAETLDFDHDGWDDLLACRGPNETPRLYRNDRGRGFVDVTRRHGLVDPVNDAVAADLDRDGDQDLVTAARKGFGYYPFEAGRFRALVPIGPLTAGQGGSVAVGDADGDGDRDVYGLVAQGRQANPDDHVWVNSRMTFTAIPVPSAGGAGDEVITVRPRRTGPAAFLVLNGHGFGETPETFVPGPVQYIRVVRR